MRSLLAALCLFPTAALADGVLRCRSPEDGVHAAQATIAGCSEMLADGDLPSVMRIPTHETRATGYRSLGDTDHELADLNFIIANAEAPPNDDWVGNLIDKVDALRRRADIHQAIGMPDKAEADFAEIDRAFKNAKRP